MNIQGLQKTTLLDYPGHVAATIFLGGCNYRCNYCHNMNIVDGVNNDSISKKEILSFLTKRAGILEGVCITGGEPTLYADLPDFLKSIKELELMVKLDTNGSNPKMLKSLVDGKLVDYVAMDIKGSLDIYAKVCGVSSLNIDAIKESIDYLKSNPCDYEFRTTFIRNYHNDTVIKDMANLLKDSSKYYIQSFVDSEYVPDHNLSSFSYDELSKIKSIFEQYINSVNIRGIDS